MSSIVLGSRIAHHLATDGPPQLPRVRRQYRPDESGRPDVDV